MDACICGSIVSLMSLVIHAVDHLNPTQLLSYYSRKQYLRHSYFTYNILQKRDIFKYLTDINLLTILKDMMLPHCAAGALVPKQCINPELLVYFSHFAANKYGHKQNIIG